MLFDVGNTLLHVPNDPHERALKAASHIGTVSLENYKAGIERSQRRWLESGGAPQEQDLPPTWAGHIRAALEFAGFAGDCGLAARLIEESFLLDGWAVFPEAESVLRGLRDLGVRMGVVSNWPVTLEATLDAAGLRKYFEVLVVSGVVGYTKPHPQIFRLALDGLGVPPDQVLLVGDSMEDDVMGAAAMGIRSILIDRSRRFAAYRDRIETLHELLDLVAN